MRVLITGATGRLGATLRRRIAENPGAIEPVLWSSTRAEDAESTAVDLADVPSLAGAVASARPDAVIHLAGMTGGACDRDPALARSVNTDATIAIATAAVEAGATRFVFASTAALYGDGGALPFAETAPLVGASEYAATKRAAEESLAQLAERSALSVASLRIFNVYGRGFDDSLVARLLASTAEAPVTLRGPDNFVRDYVLSDDVADAAIAALSAPLPGAFVPINIGTGIETTNEQLVRALERSRPVFAQSVDGAPSYSCAVISRARDLLAFAPARLAAP